MALHEINTHFTTPLNHNSNGIVERLHSTIIENYRLLKTEGLIENPQMMMRYCIIGYNNTIHSTTGYTPLELLLGHTQKKDPFDFFYEKSYYEDYVRNHKQRLLKTYEAAKTKLLNQKQKIIDKRNETAKEPKFKIGDKVCVYVAKRNKTKMKDHIQLQK